MKGFFGMATVLLVVLVASTVYGQCPGGTCTPASRSVYQAVKRAERSVLVVRPAAEIKRACITYQRTGRRFTIFRRALLR